MFRSTSRLVSSLIRAGAVAAVAAGILAASPRPVSAFHILCYQGRCSYFLGKCSSWSSIAEGFDCYDSFAAPRNPRIVRDRQGASVIDGETSSPILSDALAEMMSKAPVGRDGRMNRESSSRFRVEFEAMFRGGERRVSDEVLRGLSREMRVPIEGKDR